VNESHADEPPTDTPPSSFNPILAERPVRRFELLHRRSEIKAQVALVLVTARGDHHVYAPKQQPTIGEFIWKNTRTLYEVDMGLHQTRIEAKLPSAGDAFPFHAVVDVHWRVQEPSKIVTDGITDVREVLEPALLAQLHGVTRKYEIEQVAEAEQDAQDKLKDQPVGVEFGLWTSVFPRLLMDESSRHYFSRVRGIKRDTEVENLAQELRILKEQHNNVLLDGRIRSYRAIIAAGDLDQFALQLAQNPDDVQSVVAMIKDERDTNRRQWVDFITRLFESGAIDRWEIDDQVKSVLQWLKDTTHRVITNRPEEPRQLGPERNRNRLDPPKLPNPPLPGHADSGDDPPTGQSEGSKDVPS
jgi:hypothetical protein